MALPRKIHFKNNHPGRIWPTDAIPQAEVKQSLEEDISFRRESVSNSSIADEQGETEDIEEIDLSASITSRTIIDVKLSLCRTSTTTNTGRKHFPSASVVAAVSSEKPIHTEFDTTKSLYHMTEVVEVPAVSITTPAIYDMEQESSVPVVPPDTSKKCSSWYCPRGKSPFQVTCLVILYLVLGVIFFPLLVIVFMICCVSYFTPDID